MHARVRPGQASGAAGGGGFLQWPRNRGLHLQQGQAGECSSHESLAGNVWDDVSIWFPLN